MKPKFVYSLLTFIVIIVGIGLGISFFIPINKNYKNAKQSFNTIKQESKLKQQNLNSELKKLGLENLVTDLKSHDENLKVYDIKDNVVLIRYSGGPIESNEADSDKYLLFLSTIEKYKEKGLIKDYNVVIDRYRQFTMINIYIIAN